MPLGTDLLLLLDRSKRRLKEEVKRKKYEKIVFGYFVRGGDDVVVGFVRGYGQGFDR